MERGNRRQRYLDFGVGIPLTALVGGGKRVWNIFAPSRFAPERVHKVGVICLGAIGDLLLATALIDGICRSFPGVSVEIITSRANAAVGEILPPEWRKVSFSVQDISGIVRHARGAGYDLLFDTGQWPRISALIALASGAGYTVGFSTPGQFRHYAYDLAVPHRNDRHELSNFLALGEGVLPGFSGTPRIVIPEFPSSASPSLPQENLVLCHMWPSGLRAELKEWPTLYWRDLAMLLRKAGYFPVFTGGPGDAAATEAFLAETGLACEGVLSVAGKMCLADTASWLCRAEAVISVNTGIMHLAALGGVPTIGLHGPTNPRRWGPIGSRTVALLPRKGKSAYLNLGFEYPPDAEAVLRHLPVSDVILALRHFGLRV